MPEIEKKEDLGDGTVTLSRKVSRLGFIRKREDSGDLKFGRKKIKT